MGYPKRLSVSIEEESSCWLDIEMVLSFKVFEQKGQL